MGMSDKQYDEFLLDNIEDWNDIIELLEAKEYDKAKHPRFMPGMFYL